VIEADAPEQIEFADETNETKETMTRETRQ
jgi:hypothetical protein